METIEPSVAWHAGTNIRTAMRHDAKTTFTALTALLFDAVSYLDMNKTLRNEDDVIHAVKHLSEQFPAMKLEEWKVICDRLKMGHYGKMYERLKLPELIEVFQQYEGERAEMMERDHQRQKDERGQFEPNAMDERQKQMWATFMEKMRTDLPDSDNKRWEWIVYPNDKPKDAE